MIKGHKDFHAEKEAVYEAGLASSDYQHFDDTPTHFNGRNNHCHVICNLLYTAYFTKPGKDRLSVLDVLRQGRKRIYLLNVEAMTYLDGMPFSKETWGILKEWRSETVMEEETFIHELDIRLPILNKQHRSVVLSVAAVAAYHAERGVSIVQTLVCDDAPQFKWLTRWLALCWIHEGRHYAQRPMDKKLEPLVALHQTLLKDFLTRFWAYYDQLLPKVSSASYRTGSVTPGSGVRRSFRHSQRVRWIGQMHGSHPLEQRRIVTGLEISRITATQQSSRTGCARACPQARR